MSIKRTPVEGTAEGGATECRAANGQPRQSERARKKKRKLAVMWTWETAKQTNKQTSKQTNKKERQIEEKVASVALSGP